jgi:hypothetical protein
MTGWPSARSIDEAIVLDARVRHHQPAPSSSARHLDQDVVANLRHVDGYQDGWSWRRLKNGHGRASPKSGFDTFTLEICGPALTTCLSFDPPQALRASVGQVPNMLRRLLQIKALGRDLPQARHQAHPHQALYAPGHRQGRALHPERLPLRSQQAPPNSNLRSLRESGTTPANIGRMVGLDEIDPRSVQRSVGL